MLATKALSKMISQCRYTKTGGICSRLLIAPQELFTPYNMQRKNYHATPRDENALIIGGFTVAVSAIGLQYAVGWYNNRQKNAPESVESPEVETNQGNSTKKSSTTEGPKTGAKAGVSKEEPFYASWFTKKFYEGGFEDKMTKREAALILGVRESATAERINDNYRRILLLNHPDRGGSALISAKINEAKVILLKGKT